MAVLEARGLMPSAEVRSRIASTTDLEVLEAWIRRAVTVTSVEELLG
jgi:hypothetical protein